MELDRLMSVHHQSPQCSTLWGRRTL